MRICFLPCDFDGSGWYRCLAPAKELRTLGHEAAMPPYRVVEKDNGETLILWDIGAGHRLPDADVYVLQRRMEPSWLPVIQAIRGAGRVVVAETDDWFLGTPAYNPAFVGTRPWTRSFAIDGDDRMLIRRKRRHVNRNNMHATFAAADHLTVSTEFLAEKYARYNQNVTVLPNYLDWEMWEHVTPQYEVERPRVRVGWMGKLKWREGDLRVLHGLIGPWLERYPHVEFVSAGETLIQPDEDGYVAGEHHPRQEVHDFLGIPADRRVTYQEALFHPDRRRGAEDTRPLLADIIATMDIGLVPLEQNGFNEAKSHLKGLEYAACGIPCVATPTGSYRGWIDEGDNGFLAQRPRDWLRALDLLVNDDTLRREMGRKARAKAQEHTIQRNAWRWEELYSGLVESTAAVAA